MPKAVPSSYVVPHPVREDNFSVWVCAAGSNLWIKKKCYDNCTDAVAYATGYADGVCRVRVYSPDGAFLWKTNLEV